jgi:phage shock protein A
MSFEEQIKQWVSLDNQIKELNDKIKEIRTKRNTLEEKLITHVSSNNLSNMTVKVNNDKIKFVNTKVTEPLTFKYLEGTLNEIIKNTSQVDLIMEQIKKKRTSKIVPEIKRFYNN